MVMRWALLALLLFLPAVALADEPGLAMVQSACGSAGYSAGSPRPVTQDTNGLECVNATVSVTASITGFAPGGTYATLTATNASASVALPAGAVVVFYNTGTTTVSCTLGVGSATAAASQNIIQPSAWMAFTVGSNTFGACIDQTGSTSNLVAVAGGSGLPTGAGGGGAGTIAVTPPPAAPRHFPGCTVGVASGSCLAGATALTFLQVQNTSTANTIACAFGVAAALNTSTSVQLAVGQAASWGLNTGGVPTGQLNCIASGASTPLYVEWN